MPVQKTDTAPQPEEAGPVNVLTPEQMQDYIAELEAKMIQMEGVINSVEARTRKVENIEPATTPNIPVLPEGTKRYWHTFTEPSVFRSGAWKEVINGTPISHPPFVADFHGHVYTTSSPEMQEFLDNHPDNGITFWEDATALPQHNRPGIIEGARHSEATPRNPLEAQIP